MQLFHQRVIVGKYFAALRDRKCFFDNSHTLKLFPCNYLTSFYFIDAVEDC